MENFVNNILLFLTPKSHNEINKRLYIYIRNIVGIGFHLMNLPDDYLNLDNRMDYINQLAMSPYNNQIVNKLNELMAEIPNNINTEYYWSLSLSDKMIFEAYLIRKLLNMYDDISKTNLVDKMMVMNDEYLKKLDIEHLINFLEQTQKVLNGSGGGYCMVL